MLTRSVKRRRTEAVKTQAFHPNLLATAMSFLDICDLAWRVQRVCREWRQLVQTNPLAIPTRVFVPVHLTSSSDTTLHKFRQFALGARTREVVMTFAATTRLFPILDTLRLHKRCPNLGTLKVNNVSIGPEAVQMIAKCTLLRHLSILSPCTSHLPSMSCLSHLDTLEIGASWLDSGPIRALTPLVSKLTILSCVLPFDDEDDELNSLIGFLDKSTALESLTLDVMWPDNVEWGEYDSLTRILQSRLGALKSLSIGRLALPLSCLATLRCLTERGVMVIWQNRGIDEVLAWMDRNKSLKTQDVPDERIHVIQRNLTVSVIRLDAE
jgi:hypothetical protein